MHVLVSDTSVIIDLERGNFLETTLRLPFSFAVPDLLYERELKDNHGPTLQKLGLSVEELTSEGVQLALKYGQQVPKLSGPDTFALALAKTNNWTLLAGDGDVRNLAKQESIEIHGVLWVLDELERQSLVTLELLEVGLTNIYSNPRCRLPHAEVNTRLARYSERISISPS